VSERPSAAERVRIPEAVLSRGDLHELGWERRAIDVIFGRVPVISLPGTRRPAIRVADYLAFLAAYTFDDRLGEKVRP
jgi:hypothetical protein